MSHRAHSLEAAAPRRLDVARAREADDRRDAGHAHRRLGTLRSAEREVDDVTAPRGYDAASGLRRDRRLERQLVQHVGLEKLALGDRSRDLEEGLVGEDDAALGDCR